MKRRSPGRGVASALLVGLLPHLGACYSYVPAPVESFTPPAAVRAHITSAAAASLEETLGEPRSVLDGELVATTPDGIFIVVPVAAVPMGIRTEVLTQQLLISRQELVALERRTLDRTRTGAFAAAVAAALGVVLYRTLSDDPGGDPTPPGTGGPAEVSAPRTSVPSR